MIISVNNTDDNSTNNNTFKLEPPKLICPLNRLFESSSFLCLLIIFLFKLNNMF